MKTKFETSRSFRNTVMIAILRKRAFWAFQIKKVVQPEDGDGESTAIYMEDTKARRMFDKYNNLFNRIAARGGAGHPSYEGGTNTVTDADSLKPLNPAQDIHEQRMLDKRTRAERVKLRKLDTYYKISA